MTEILPAFEVLVNNNCLTIAEAIEKAYIAGHRAATKALEPTQLTLVGVDSVVPAKSKFRSNP